MTQWSVWMYSLPAWHGCYGASAAVHSRLQQLDRASSPCSPHPQLHQSASAYSQPLHSKSFTHDVHFERIVSVMVTTSDLWSQAHWFKSLSVGHHSTVMVIGLNGIVFDGRAISELRHWSLSFSTYIALQVRLLLLFLIIIIIIIIIIITAWMHDCLWTGKSSQYIIRTMVNSTFHPSRVSKSSTSQAGHFYLRWVAGNTVWSHMAGDTRQLRDGSAIKNYTI